MKTKFVILTLFITLLLILLSDPSVIIADGSDGEQDTPEFIAWTGLAPGKTPDGTVGGIQSAEATVTVQLAPNSTKTLTYSICNYAYTPESFTWVESPVVNWLSIDPVSGVVPPRACASGYVIFDSTDKVGGLYSTRVLITGSNWQPGYYDISMEVVPIEVTSATPCVVGPYYFDPSFSPFSNATNAYDINIDWGVAAPDHILFSVNGSTAQVATSGDTVTHDVLLQELDYSLLSQENIIEIVAVSDEGAESEPFTYEPSPYGVWLPTWLQTDEIEFTYPDTCGSAMKVAGEFKWPTEPLDANAQPPNWVPFVGGETIGVKENTYVMVNTDFSGSGQFSLNGGGGTGFEIAGQSVGISAYAGGSGNILPNAGLESTSEFGLTGNGKISADEPAVDVICKAFSAGLCDLETAESLPVIGEAIRWFNNRARVEIALEPSIDLKLNFTADEDDVTWDSGTALLKTKATISMIINAIENVLEVHAYGGGEIGSTLQVPAPYFKKLETDLFAGFKIIAWGFIRPFKASYPTCIGDCTSMAAQQHALIESDSNWHPIPRDYIQVENDYSQFHIGQATENNLWAATSNITATQSLKIASNVFPYNHPVIAADNNNAALVWVHDDISKPLMQSEELYYTPFDGTQWFSPTLITDDNLQDFNPKIAFDAQGKTIVVWERNKTEQAEDAQLDAAYTNAFEIAYSVLSGTTWSPPIYITNNAALDHAPELVRGNDGNLLLLWRQNGAGELIGTNANPDQIYYAVWDGIAWSTPEILIADAAYVLGLSAARFDDNQMDVIYSQDTDSDLATPNDQELYRIAWNSTVWSNPTAITADTVPDSQPTLFYSETATPRLLWFKGQQLYALMDDWNAIPNAILSDQSAGMLDYNAAQDTDGNLVLTWQAYSAEGTDIFYAAYDEAHNSFSFNRQLTYDEPLEKYMDTAYIAPGEMILAFDKTELILTDVTVLTDTISNITDFGQSDLHVLRHTFGQDLIPEISMVQADSYPIESASQITVTTTILNDGDWAVENPQIDFIYASQFNPQGVALPSITIPILLSGGMTTTVTSLINVTNGDIPYYFDATLDLSNQVQEWDETNNNTRHRFIHYTYLPMISR